MLRLFFIGIFSFVLSVNSLANGRVETVRFQSKLINAPLPYNVILPADYATSTTTRYPVLYLLHGLTGHYSDHSWAYWDRQVQEVLQLAAQKMRLPSTKAFKIVK
jgi:S-formylglutathione hydrolase FrmB